MQGCQLCLSARDRLQDKLCFAVMRHFTQE